MSAEIKTNLHLEIAHILFIDVVGYSKLLMQEQRLRHGRLFRAREEKHFQRDGSRSKIVSSLRNVTSEMANTISTATTSRSVALSRLIAGVRDVVRSETRPERVGQVIADLLRPCLSADDLLTTEQLEPSGTTYRQHILHVEADGSFSVVALVWLPGQATPIHDHVSWCVVGVYHGAEHETVYELAGEESDPHLRVIGHAINAVGSIAALVPPGDIHHVENAGEGLAVSLHIYGADIAALGSSIRRRYDLEVRSPAEQVAGMAAASPDW